MKHGNADEALNTLTEAIVYEDNDVVVINKPSGIAVHGDGRQEQFTIVDWFLTYVPSARGVGEAAMAQDGVTPLERSGVVHRLDRDTSGALLLTKHQTAHEFCKQQFHDRLVQKEYRAFVYGKMPDCLGSIDRPIGRSAKDWRKRSAERGAKGTLREAVTHWEEIGAGKYMSEWFSYIILRPKTGRTHQLRVHCKAIDRPIVQDPLYAGARRQQSTNVGFDRLALHAHILELDLPNQSQVRVVAPVPESFHKAADQIAEQ